MFLVPLKTLWIEQLKAVFGASYPQVDFRNIWIDMEYPAEQANYPGIWVDFTPTTPLQTAGIDHHEFIVDPVTHQYQRIGRWRYGGMVQLTCVALSSLERDRLVDEMVRLVAFGRDQVSTAGFRAGIETNDLIACQVQWDRLSLGGKSETPGAPWGTDEVVYEMTASVDCQGEFIPDTATGGLVALSAVVLWGGVSGALPAPGTAAPLSGSVPSGSASPNWPADNPNDPWV